MNNDILMYSPSKSRIENSQMTKFQKYIEEKYKKTFNSYQELHQFSVKQNQDFWSDLFNFFQVIYEGELNPSLLEESFNSYTWFTNVKINFSENLISNKNKDKIALNFVHESGLSKKTTYGELYLEVAKLQKYFKSILNVNDVVACYMPNIKETVVSMLAANSIGAVFTSTSSDFGVNGVLDRFSQSKPKIIVASIGYEYGGKYFDQTDKLVEIEKNLSSLEELVIVDFLNKGIDLSKFKKAKKYTDVINNDNVELTFLKLPFSHPLYIMYSSGTTGKPKCIVHSQGGTLLQHIKELGLHSDLTSNKTIMFFTTCGWMMWNWLVSSLFFESTIVLYEGSPAHPSPKQYFEIIDREKINIFGTSPKFLKAMEDTETKFDTNFNSLETILSTGSPLLPEQYDFVYKTIKKDLLLSSISGGTDIIGCFMLGNPNLEVYRGEIQCLGLGMDVVALDDNQSPIIDKEGELCCRKTFPSRPIYFLDDLQNEKMNSAYFNQNIGFWTHGDFVKITKRGSVIVYGRSDATLNPGGVRIGTAEIYRQTESLDFIEDSLCVGRPSNGDVDVILFVKLKNNIELTNEHKKLIKDSIKKNTTPRHVPREIYKVSEIPYTRSGKKVELAVTRILSNKLVTNLEALTNPDSLREYYQFIGQ